MLEPNQRGIDRNRWDHTLSSLQCETCGFRQGWQLWYHSNMDFVNCIPLLTDTESKTCKVISLSMKHPLFISISGKNTEAEGN